MPTKSQAFTSSGTFVVPAGVTGIWLTLMGAGGGAAGSGINSVSQGGGGSGERAENLFMAVTPGASLTVTVGVGGTHGSPTAGGDTTIGLYRAAGGGRSEASNTLGNGGGGGRGGGGAGFNSEVNWAFNGGGFITNGSLGLGAAPCFFGGSSGGSGNSGPLDGKVGGASGGYNPGAVGGTAAAVRAGGGGGASTIFGNGGVGGNSQGNGVTATNIGTGAGGGGGNNAGTTTIGGDGAPGYAAIFWKG